MGGYRQIIIQILEGNIEIQMIFCGICHYDIDRQIFGCREEENLEHQILATTEMRLMPESPTCSKQF